MDQRSSGTYFFFMLMNDHSIGGAQTEFLVAPYNLWTKTQNKRKDMLIKVIEKCIHSNRKTPSLSLS